jgi:hypothetical protein
MKRGATLDVEAGDLLSWHIGGTVGDYLDHELFNSPCYAVLSITSKVKQRAADKAGAGEQTCLQKCKPPLDTFQALQG